MIREQRSRSVESVIDDAVARASGGESRCACGCGMVLAPDGPSAWFATPTCQTRWQARDATRPAEVWRGQDAAQVFPEHDSMPIPLTGDGTMSFDLSDVSVEAVRAAFGSLSAAMAGLVAAVAPLPELAWTTSPRDPAPPWPAGDLPARLRYTRWCGHCRKRVVPVLVTVVVPSPATLTWETFPDAIVAAHETRLAHGCGCGTPFNGPALWSAVRRNLPYRMWELTLTDDPDAERGPVMRVTDDVVRHCAGAAQVAWEDLERALEVRRR